MPYWVYVGPSLRQYVCPFLDAFYCNNKKSFTAAARSICISTTNPGTQLSHSCTACSYSRDQERRSGCPQSLSEWAATIFRGRYQAMLPPENVSNMPSPAQAIVRASRFKFLQADLSSSKPIASLTTSLLRHEVTFLPDGSNLTAIRRSL